MVKWRVKLSNFIPNRLILCCLRIHDAPKKISVGLSHEFGGNKEEEDNLVNVITQLGSPLDLRVSAVYNYSKCCEIFFKELRDDRERTSHGFLIIPKRERQQGIATVRERETSRHCSQLSQLMS